MCPEHRKYNEKRHWKDVDRLEYFSIIAFTHVFPLIPAFCADFLHIKWMQSMSTSPRPMLGRFAHRTDTGKSMLATRMPVYITLIRCGHIFATQTSANATTTTSKPRHHQSRFQKYFLLAITRNSFIHHDKERSAHQRLVIKVTRADVDDALLSSEQNGTEFFIYHY